jgi:acyl-CoA thioesterase II
MAGALGLDRLDERWFRAVAPRAGRPRRVFGGQLMAQAALAAGRTVPAALAPHLLHARFVRRADPALDLDYHVDPFVDRGAFAHRRVIARQGEADILELTGSYHRDEDGPEHQFPARIAGDPEGLPTFGDLARSGDDDGVRQWWTRLSQWLPVDVRATTVPGRWRPAPGDEFVPHQQVWLQTHDGLDPDPRVHTAAATYSSDLFLLTAAMVRHGLRHDDADVLAVTLNHTMWFHRPFRTDQWWRYDQEGSWSGAGRLLCRGQMFDRDGHLVATVMQEGLLRVGASAVEVGARRLAG